MATTTGCASCHQQLVVEHSLKCNDCELWYCATCEEMRQQDFGLRHCWTCWPNRMTNERLIQWLLARTEMDYSQAWQLAGHDLRCQVGCFSPDTAPYQPVKRKRPNS